MDLNHRSHTTTDLQSVPFGHSGTPPHYSKQSKTKYLFQPDQPELHTSILKSLYINFK